jgi:urease accessory protein
MALNNNASSGASPGLGFLLQSSDSMFPSGAYAHSFGLEGAVQDDVVCDVKSYSNFLRDFVLPQIIHLELPMAGLAFDAAVEADLGRLCSLDERYGAMKATKELRTASARIGTQRLALAADLLDDSFISEVHNANENGQLAGHEVLAVGVQCAQTGMSRSDALGVVYYLSLSVLTNAIVKLIRIGQTDCQRILAANLGQINDVIRRAQVVAEEEIGWFSPLTDIVSARHETAYSRLFIS